MRLAIDIGNTLSKAIIFDHERQIGPMVFDLNEPSGFFRWVDSYGPQFGMLATVRHVSDELLVQLRSRMQLEVLDHHTRLPFVIDYQTPETLGRDRIAAVAAAYGRFPKQDVLVIDMGSCITYDFIDSGGVYRGGAISPGMQMRFRAMQHFTDKLPLATAVEDAVLPGKSTMQSLQAGVMCGLEAELNGMIAHFEALSSGLKVIVGGGDNNFFDKKFKISIFATSNLVLEGLKVIMEYNDIE